MQSQTISERDELLGMISDMHKDVYGYRLRVDMSNCTMGDLHTEIRELQTRLDQQILEDQARQAESVKQFESRVAEIMQAGAPDRDTAIRWMIQSESDPVYDQEFLEYTWELPYGYISQTAQN